MTKRHKCGATTRSQGAARLTWFPLPFVPQGILEQVTTATVNLVNADLLAKNRGLAITETTRPSSGK